MVDKGLHVVAYMTCTVLFLDPVATPVGPVKSWKEITGPNLLVLRPHQVALNPYL